MHLQKACYLDVFLVGEAGKDRRCDSPLADPISFVIVNSLEPPSTLVHGADEAAQFELLYSFWVTFMAATM